MGHIHEHTYAASEHEHGAIPVPDDGRKTPRAKLIILLPHWIEHNQEHAESFRERAEKARELGLEAVAEQIEVAVERMVTCGQALAAALKEMEEE